MDFSLEIRLNIGYVCPHISKVKRLRQSNCDGAKTDYVIGKMSIKSEMLSPVISNNENLFLNKRI